MEAKAEGVIMGPSDSVRLLCFSSDIEWGAGRPLGPPSDSGMVKLMKSVTPVNEG